MDMFLHKNLMIGRFILISKLTAHYFNWLMNIYGILHVKTETTQQISHFLNTTIYFPFYVFQH